VRIVHLVPHLNYGGVQEVVRSLALEQKRRGHDVAVLCWEYPGNHPEAEQELVCAGVSVAGARHSSDRRFAALRTFRQRLGDDRIDVLHVHNPFEYCAYGAVAGRLRRGTNIVLTMHASAMFDRFGWKHKAYFVLGARLTHRMVAVCDEIRDVTIQRFRLDPSKVVVVENGIDAAPFLQVPSRPRTDHVVFGAVGRISKVKNQPLLVNAFAQARQRHPNITLRLLGGGASETPKLRALADDLGVGDAVEFREFSADVAGFLSEIDVFVLPSRSEGLPLCLLEAVAAGLPVIATDVGGSRNVIESTQSGWVCVSDDTDSMLQAMETSLADTDVLARSLEARGVVAERYSVARMTTDYERVYASVARSSWITRPLSRSNA
jgi:glycosyltransferase involved in cell wall biosynthesis